MFLARASAVCAMLAVLLAGCGGRDERSSQARLDQAESERTAREVDASLELVETRLLSGRATVRLWQELAARHKGVSAIACASAEAHVDGMDLASRKERAQLAKHRVEAGTMRAQVKDARAVGFQAPEPAGAPPPERAP